MKKLDAVRALRDAEYRSGLSAEELALLPSHPAGPSTIEDGTLKSLTGGCGNTACSCGGGPTSILWSCSQPGRMCP